MVARSEGEYRVAHEADLVSVRDAMRDRTDGDTLLITQDLLAEMLGAHRPSITHAARDFEVAGLIERGRRQVTILDREGLKRESCECYQLVQDRIAFHLPRTYS
jgi:hypothetical protein